LTEVNESRGSRESISSSPTLSQFPWRRCATRTSSSWLQPTGIVAFEYRKHHPVPGEPAVRGDAPLQAATLGSGGRASGAICYDYDFPHLAREHARLGLDVVALPSSDWRGIDPIHTQIAAIRAIEGGFSLVRSTRLGLSAAVDATGRVRASASYFESDNRVLLGNVPSRGVRTFYAVVGNLFVYLCLAMVGGVVMSQVFRRNHPRVAVTAGSLFLFSACSLSTSGPPIAAYDNPTTALVLLDLQKDFLAPDGKLPVAPHQVEPVLLAAEKLVEVAPDSAWEVVYVVNEFDRGDWPANSFRNHAAIRGEPGAAKDPRVPVVDVPTFAKSAPDGFSNSEFDAYLRSRSVNHLIIVGVFADGCVKHTARGALNRRYQVTVVRDGVADDSDESVADALATLESEGVRVQTSSDLAKALPLPTGN
jgi:nicotinamidase-related amidase